MDPSSRQGFFLQQRTVKIAAIYPTFLLKCPKDNMEPVRTEKRQPRKVMIVAMPWALPETPSIQIGVLKRYLSDRGVLVAAKHCYLNVAFDLGFDTYAGISLSASEANVAEAIYSYLLFPEMRSFLLHNEALAKEARNLKKKLLKSSTDTPKTRFRWNKRFFKEFEALHQEILDRHDWTEYALVGFTLGCRQTVASLYMAREIKRRNPDCKIIVGGAEVSGELGASLLETFSQLDYACNGEGELPLLHLSKALLGGCSKEDICAIKGITYRGEGGNIIVNSPQQIDNLDALEPPDFDEYFDCLSTLKIDPQIIVKEILIEASRGCPFSCNFCSLNIQWENFRSRSPEKVNDDIRELSQKYKILTFHFMNNLLPNNSKEIFKNIADQNVDYRFFCEARVQTPPDVLRLMKKAGVAEIQFGIEALSTSVLKKLNKKTKFIDNLQAMKLGEELNIVMNSNLMVDIPWCSEEEIEETIRNMDYCLAYRPLIVMRYTLSAGCTDYEHRKERGFRSVENAKFYQYIYPPALLKKLDLICKQFTRFHPMTKWNRVVNAVSRWEKLYHEGKNQLPNGRKSLLCYFDGGTFIQIVDCREYVDGTSNIYVFEGLQREVYLFADEIRPWDAFRKRFPLEKSKLRALLQCFIESKLMYEEDGHYLSLAMNTNPNRPVASSRTFSSLKRISDR